MIELSQKGQGAATHEFAVRNNAGRPFLPIQVHVVGSATYRVCGRVSPEAPWLALCDERTTGFIEAWTWVPHFQLEVLNGSGSVTLWAGES